MGTMSSQFIYLKAKIYFITYIDYSLSINQPHDSRPGVASNTTAESSPISFSNFEGFRFGDKLWSCFRFYFLFFNFLSSKVRNRNGSIILIFYISELQRNIIENEASLINPPMSNNTHCCHDDSISLIISILFIPLGS